MKKRTSIDYLLSEDDWATLSLLKERILNECEICDHTGHRLAKGEIQKGVWTKTIACSCLKKFRRFKEYYKARMPETYWRLDDKNFKGDKSALKTALKYCDNLDNAIKHGLGILFWGDNGNGKTTLACIIGKYAVKNGYTLLYGTLQSYLNMIMDSFASDNLTEKVRDLIKGVDLLIIDELGKEHIKKNESTGTVFGLSEFEQFLRYREGNKKTMIALSNMRPPQLETRYGSSISSLFQGMMKPIEVSGTDMRRTLKAKSWDALLTEGK